MSPIDLDRLCTERPRFDFGTLDPDLVSSAVSQLAREPRLLSTSSEFLVSHCLADGASQGDVIHLLMCIREVARQQKQFTIADSLQAELSNKYGIACQSAKPQGRLTWRNRQISNRDTSHVPNLAQEALDVSVRAVDIDDATKAVTIIVSEIATCMLNPNLDKYTTNSLRMEQYADIAFKLSLAGCTHMQLFEKLARGCTEAFSRIDANTSALQAMRVIERFTAAGVRQEDCPQLFDYVKKLLASSHLHVTATARDLLANKLSLFSEKPLQLLFSHKVRRQGINKRTSFGAEAVHLAVEKLNDGLSDLPLPLILDLGCGLGVSALGLAHDTLHSVLAIDSSAHCIGYAKSIAKRWGLSTSRIKFEQCNALDALHATISKFRGTIDWILINFPAPFAITENGIASGNSHLPSSVNSAEFMPGMELLAAAHTCARINGGCGLLLVQSSVEDVAVAIRKMGESTGWIAVSDESYGLEVLDFDAVPTTKRNMRNATCGGVRAVGAGWLKTSPLPAKAASETEKHYDCAGTPIHRVILKPVLL